MNNEKSLINVELNDRLIKEFRQVEAEAVKRAMIISQRLRDEANRLSALLEDFGYGRTEMGRKCEEFFKQVGAQFKAVDQAQREIGDILRDFEQYKDGWNFCYEMQLYHSAALESNRLDRIEQRSQS